MQCATHPKVETELRCGKCDRPICPRCLVYTPVGARCRSCAQLRPLPIFRVSALQYTKAAGAAVGGGAVVGVFWGAIPLGGWLSLLLAGGVGYLLGEAVSWSVNRKRGLGLQTVAGLGFLWASLVAQVSPWLLGRLAAGASPGLEVLARALASALLNTVLNPLAWFVLLIGIVVAASRLRE